MTSTFRSQINSNVGRVVEVLKGGQRIIVQAMRGGRFACANKGFELGDVLCYTFDTVTKKITSLIPKAVADVQAMIARDEQLQLTLQEDGNVRDSASKGGHGEEIEIPADQCSLVSGTTGLELLEWGESSYADFDPDWLERRRGFQDEGEWPDDIPFHLPPR